jgi:hypothetical protein
MSLIAALANAFTKRESDDPGLESVDDSLGEQELDEQQETEQEEAQATEPEGLASTRNHRHGHKVLRRSQITQGGS